jgi:hypothetical protein
VAAICKYGNLHISTKNRTAEKKFKDAITKSLFTFLNDERCYNEFSKSGAINGRTITV